MFKRMLVIEGKKIYLDEGSDLDIHKAPKKRKKKAIAHHPLYKYWHSIRARNWQRRGKGMAMFHVSENYSEFDTFVDVIPPLPNGMIKPMLCMIDESIGFIEGNTEWVEYNEVRRRISAIAR